MSSPVHLCRSPSPRPALQPAPQFPTIYAPRKPSTRLFRAKKAAYESASCEHPLAHESAAAAEACPKPRISGAWIPTPAISGLCRLRTPPRYSLGTAVVTSTETPSMTQGMRSCGGSSHLGTISVTWTFTPIPTAPLGRPVPTNPDFTMRKLGWRENSSLLAENTSLMRANT